MISRAVAAVSSCVDEPHGEIGRDPQGGFTAALRARDDNHWLVWADGGSSPLPTGRWHAAAEPALDQVVSRCDGPALDVGCGPGRLTVALARAGITAVGVDVCAYAVRLTRQRGAAAVHRSVFSALPAEGRWAQVLLIDGNIGIGGDPVALLRRCRKLLRSGGTVLVELEAPGIGLRQGLAQVVSRERGPVEPGRFFSWACVGVEAMPAVARSAGLHVREVCREDGRWFAELAAAS